MILVGVGMMIAMPIVAAIYLPGEAVLGLLGLFRCWAAAGAGGRPRTGGHQAAASCVCRHRRSSF